MADRNIANVEDEVNISVTCISEVTGILLEKAQNMPPDRQTAIDRMYRAIRSRVLNDHDADNLYKRIITAKASSEARNIAEGALEWIKQNIAAQKQSLSASKLAHKQSSEKGEVEMTAVAKKVKDTQLKSSKTAAAQAKAGKAEKPEPKKAKAVNGNASDNKEKRRGRKSELSGTIIANVDVNPRREGTNGHRSMEIIISSKKGISVDDFVAAGGRLNDLRWDIDKGNVKLSK